MQGLGGDDTLAGLGGADTLQGGGGSGTADFSWSPTDVSVDLAADRESKSDVMLVSIENVIGSTFDDTLQGTIDANLLQGLGGNDTLIGLGGLDTLDGGAGSDTADFSWSAIDVSIDLAAGLESKSNVALVSIENVVGSAFGDYLRGTAGANFLAGGNGNDTLEGLGGLDTLDGGDGNDTADFSWSATDVSIDLAAGLEFSKNVTLLSVENAIGTDADDVLRGEGGANWLDGRGGDDAVEGRDGNDTLVGGDGADTLDGGTGTDEARYDLAAAAVTVNLATGRATGGAGNDSLVSVEVVVGSAFDDALTGNAGANFLAGGNGNDTLEGDAGNDTLVGGAGDDLLDGGDGEDLADYSQAAGPLAIDLAADTATGDGNDVLVSVEHVVGGAGNDNLMGNAGANFLAGGFGDDTLDGGAGDDSLFGGAGADLFVFGAGHGVDVINDYEVGTDHIRLLQAGFDTSFSLFANGADTVVLFGSGDLLYLVNVAPASLTPEDFILA